MKKQNNRVFATISFAFLSAVSLAGCSSNDAGTLIIKALNCEDYIGEDAFDYTYINPEGEEVTVTYDDETGIYTCIAIK